MLEQLYKLHLSYLYFMKGLYKKRTADNSINAAVLGIGFIIMNLHSVIILLECFTNVDIGLLEFWKPSNSPKVGLGYIFGGAFAVIFLFVINSLKRNISEKNRRILMKQIVLRGTNRTASVMYTLFSVLLILGSLVLAIVTVIPEGGIK